MSEFRPQLLAAEFSLFLTVQLLGLWVGWTILQTVPVPKMETGPAIFWFLIIFAIATGVILLALKFFKARLPFSLLFAFLIFIGAHIVFSTFLPNTIAIALAIGIAGLRFIWPNILTQNIAIIISISGISALLGAQLPVLAVIVLLIVLSVYDVWAVFKTKHMVTMAKGLIQRGMAPMIVMPTSWRDFTKGMKEVETEKLRPVKKRPSMKYMMLGTGDLAFPLVFAVSALTYGLLQAYAVIMGALAGIFVIHILMTQRKFPALPALPPIAIGSIIAFGISLLI